MKSCRVSSELIFVVLNFVTPEARYANDEWCGKFRDSRDSHENNENYPLYGIYIYIYIYTGNRDWNVKIAQSRIVRIFSYSKYIRTCNVCIYECLFCILHHLFIGLAS